MKLPLKTNNSEDKGKSVQSLSRVRLFATPQTAARQASLSRTISWSLLKLMSMESVVLSNHLLCCPLLLLPSVFPSQHWCLVFRARKSNSHCSIGSESARRTEEGATRSCVTGIKTWSSQWIFFFLKFVVYLFMFGVAESSLLLHRPSLFVASQGYSFSACRASHCGCLSCCGAQVP